MVLKVIDLFSGCGGMSWGFSRDKRFKLIGAADLEVAKPSMGIGATKCNSTYERNLGVAPVGIDLSVATPDEILKEMGISKADIDVMISCAPCTGFSQKNSRNHIKDDPRNRLVQRTGEFVEAFKPKYLVMENVKELLKGRHVHHFRVLHEKMNELGYGVFAEIHDLSEFGLPQRRTRALIVAKKGGSLSLNLPRTNKVKTVRDAISHLPLLEAGGADELDSMHRCPSMSGASMERMKAIPKDGGSWTDIPEDKAHLRIPSMNVAKPGSFPDIYGRLAWNKPAPTITRECSHPGNGRYCHPDQDRLLSVREMSLLQGFPEEYQFEGELSSRYRQIGDAVPPMISEMIGRAVADDHEGKIKSSFQTKGQMKLAV